MLQNNSFSHSIPFWIFALAVALPLIGGVAAEILIWWKNKDRY
jgi:hypothetical protein